MADSMDNDHVASLTFAHWPGAGSPWYDDLRRIAALCPAALGKFMLLDDYFAHTDMPGRLSKFAADEYRTPYLQQTIQRRQSDACSAFVREHAAGARRAAARAISTLADLARGSSETSLPEVDDARALDVAVERLASALPRGSGAAVARYLVVNPHSFARSIGVEIPAGAKPSAAAMPTAASPSADERQFAVVEVPAMGFAWVEPGEATSAAKSKPIARDNVLANEFLEVTVSRTTGGISSIYDFNHRSNQLSQQIALRIPGAPPEPGSVWRDPDDDATYTTMQAESVEVLATCTAFGEIVSRGQLVDASGRRLAGFHQRTQVWSASPVVRIEIELVEPEEPRADPWNSYYAARFAWPDDTAELTRGVSLSRAKTDARRIEAPEYLDVESPSGHVTILTGGLPYHRRIGQRMLDSLLVVRGERARHFNLGVGVGIAQPAPAAAAFHTPATGLLVEGPPPSAASGWFFHVDAKNVLATHWQPVWDEHTENPATSGQPGMLRGVRVRLLETAGRAGRVTLRAFRPVAHARQVDFVGQTLLEVAVEGDRVRLDFAANEWIEVEVMFAA
jgi:alpha-mannosidase